MIGADLGRLALLATIPLAAMLGHVRMNFVRMNFFCPVILAAHKVAS
jgi:hypothetical protein